MSDLSSMLTVVIPIILGVFGAMCLYFGRIILRFQIFKSDRTDYYIRGLFFSLIFIVAPLIIYLCFRALFTINEISIWKNFLNNMVTTWYPILTIILLIPSIPIIIIIITTLHLSKNCMSYYEYSHKRILLNYNKGKTKLFTSEKILKKILSNTFYFQFLLVVLSIIIITPVLIYLDEIILSSTQLANIDFSLFLSALFYWFCLITCIAMVYGYMLVSYPIYTVYYEVQGFFYPQVIHGKIFGSSETAISIKSGNNIHQINRNRIIEIKRRV